MVRVATSYVCSLSIPSSEGLGEKFSELQETGRDCYSLAQQNTTAVVPSPTPSAIKPTNNKPTVDVQGDAGGDCFFSMVGSTDFHQDKHPLSIHFCSGGSNEKAEAKAFVRQMVRFLRSPFPRCPERESFCWAILEHQLERGLAFDAIIKVSPLIPKEAITVLKTLQSDSDLGEKARSALVTLENKKP